MLSESMLKLCGICAMFTSSTRVPVLAGMLNSLGLKKKLPPSIVTAAADVSMASWEAARLIEAAGDADGLALLSGDALEFAPELGSSGSAGTLGAIAVSRLAAWDAGTSLKILPVFPNGPIVSCVSRYSITQH
jgi:hypothetical protein